MAREHDSDSALARAVRAAGSQSAFGRLIGKRQSVVNDWLRDETPLDAKHVLTVERETGISRHELRPDVYGPAPAAQPPRPGAADQMEPAR
jgi:DNA-binding transcriptional regulator YdaS (Cro superfamily)